MFEKRSIEPERIDKGDYTPEEYGTFLREIRFINRYLGDARALRKSLFREIETNDLYEFSVLDVACGSGELLRQTAAFARGTNRIARLTGIDLHELSFSELPDDEAAVFSEINYVRGDAFRLPFAEGAFDYTISSLFLHHLTDPQIPVALAEMARVARRAVFVIDLHRHRLAYLLYKIFCLGFGISDLVTQDGALSILRGFRPGEVGALNAACNVETRVAPFRLIFRMESPQSKKYE